MRPTLQAVYGSTGVLSKAGLAAGTNSATIKTAAPNGAGTDFMIDGLSYHKADTDNIAVTALAVQADLTKCLYLVQINASGTVSVKKGNECLTADVAAGRAQLQWPQPDDSNCPIGGFKVTMSGGTFTAGTTDDAGTGVTMAFYDFGLAGPPSGLTS